MGVVIKQRSSCRAASAQLLHNVVKDLTLNYKSQTQRSAITVGEEASELLHQTSSLYAWLRSLEDDVIDENVCTPLFCRV
jgi:hypothetical protein